MIETRTIIQSIFYILKKLGPTDKIKLIKLIYLTDKYHLLLYGRTVTNDDYYAMAHGPVGTTVKDILNPDSSFLSRSNYDLMERLFKKVNNNTYKLKNEKVRVNFDMFSSTDFEALDFVLDKFGAMNQWELSRFTHKFPEWKQYEKLFKNKSSKRERIEITELLSTDDKFLKIPNSHIKKIKQLLTGIS